MHQWLLLAICLAALRANADPLPPAVSSALRAAGIPPSAISIVVRDVQAASPRLAVNARQAMNPASVIKLLTTHAALDTLGPAYAWKTEALAAGDLRDGVLRGDLILKGGGDPRLTYEQLWRLLRMVRERGVREIAGDLVLDRGAFAVAEADPAPFDGQPLRPYNVSPDALLVNFKAVTLRFVAEADGRVTVAAEPPLANLDVVSQVRANSNGASNGNGCGDWKERLRADLFRHGDRARLVLTGHFPAACGEQRWNFAVLDHVAFAGGLFRQLWAELGGEIRGGVRDGAAPAEARSLAVLPSPSMAEVVRDINKYSNNVMARQLFLTLGMEAGKRPARAEDGDAAVRAWLEARGLRFPELVLENGSGLSRRERISAENLDRLLQAAWRSATMPEFIASLPVSAVDGTMRRRLKQNGVAGQAHIKTGSLEGVRSIAGYVLDRGGRRWAVVFMVNHPNAMAAQPAMDALLQWTWEQGG